MHISTLFFLAAASSLLHLVCASRTKFPTCKYGVLKRREWRLWSEADQQYFLSLLLKLQERPKDPPTALSAYDKLVKVHGDGAAPLHGYPVFLPWHRWYLVELEQMIQAIADRPIALPYWKWELDAGSPENAPVWNEKTFGKDGEGPADRNSWTKRCVKTGKFANWRPRSNPDLGEHCLLRRFDGVDQQKPGKLSAFYTSEMINALMTSAKSFDVFRFKWESEPHGGVHNSIGGDMTTMYSPNDPIFFLHHANVDKVWADWQALRPENARAYDGNNQDGAEAKLTDKIPFYDAWVEDLMDTKKLCYEYEEYVAVAKPPMVERLPPPTKDIVDAALKTGTWVKKDGGDIVDAKTGDVKVKKDEWIKMGGSATPSPAANAGNAEAKASGGEKAKVATPNVKKPEPPPPPKSVPSPPPQKATPPTNTAPKIPPPVNTAPKVPPPTSSPLTPTPAKSPSTVPTVIPNPLTKEFVQIKLDCKDWMQTPNGDIIDAKTAALILKAADWNKMKSQAPAMPPTPQSSPPPPRSPPPPTPSPSKPPPTPTPTPSSPKPPTPQPNPPPIAKQAPASSPLPPPKPSTPSPVQTPPVIPPKPSAPTPTPPVAVTAPMIVPSSTPKIPEDNTPKFTPAIVPAAPGQPSQPPVVQKPPTVPSFQPGPSVQPSAPVLPPQRPATPPIQQASPPANVPQVPPPVIQPLPSPAPQVNAPNVVQPPPVQVKPPTIVTQPSPSPQIMQPAPQSPISNPLPAPVPAPSVQVTAPMMLPPSTSPSQPGTPLPVVSAPSIPSPASQVPTQPIIGPAPLTKALVEANLASGVWKINAAGDVVIPEKKILCAADWEKLKKEGMPSAPSPQATVPSPAVNPSPVATPPKQAPPPPAPSLGPMTLTKAMVDAKLASGEWVKNAQGDIIDPKAGVGYLRAAQWQALIQQSSGYKSTPAVVPPPSYTPPKTVALPQAPVFPPQNKPNPSPPAYVPPKPQLQPQSKPPAHTPPAQYKALPPPAISMQQIIANLQNGNWRYCEQSNNVIDTKNAVVVPFANLYDNLKPENNPGAVPKIGTIFKRTQFRQWGFLSNGDLVEVSNKRVVLRANQVPPEARPIVTKFRLSRRGFVDDEQAGPENIYAVYLVSNTPAPRVVKLVRRADDLAGGNAFQSSNQIAPKPVQENKPLPSSTEAPLTTLTDRPDASAPDPLSRSIVNRIPLPKLLEDAWLRINNLSPQKYNTEIRPETVKITEDINSVPKLIPSTSPLLNLDLLVDLIKRGELLYLDYAGPDGKAIRVQFSATDALQAASNLLAKLEVALKGEVSAPAKEVAAQLKTVVGDLVTTQVAPCSKNDVAVVPEKQMSQLLAQNGTAQA